MARSAVVDPLEKFRFTIEWSNSGSDEATALQRAGFHDVQLPKRNTNEITYREGIDRDIMQKSAGISTFDNIVMSRGLIAGGAQEMYSWMSSVHSPSAGASGAANRAAGDTRPADAAANQYRKDITISQLDREGNIARQWVVYQAFVVNFTPGSDLDASEDGDKSLEQITLAYEDFQELTAPAVSPSL